MRTVGGCVGALLGVLALLTAASPVPASAVPGDGAPAAAPTLSLAELGAVGPLELYGQTGTATLTVPVPPGLRPGTLNAVVERPVFLRSAVLTVVQNRRTVAEVPLPPEPRASLSIPLDGVIVENNALTVTIHSYLLPEDGYCLDPTNPLRLVDGSVTFTGTEAVPVAIADFLPPVLRRLTIAIPDEPSLAESDAALRLGTAVAAQYRQQNVGVEVTALPDGQGLPPAASAPLERQVAIREGPDPGLSLQGGPGVPVLRISGPAAELTNQTRLLASDLRRLAVSSGAVVGPLEKTPQLPGDSLTLRELGEIALSAQALAPQVTIGIDATRLGRSARDIRIHLQGSYTPAPENIGAQLVVRVGDEVIDRWAAQPDGVIDRWVQLPDRVLQRFTSVDVAMEIAGVTGRCGEFAPLTLTIDDDSVVQSAAADPPVPPGLQSLPQAMLPRIEIGLGAERFADTARAMAILAGLQQVSALPLDTAAVEFAQAADGVSPAVLIAAEGWDRDDIPLPVALSEGELTVDAVDTAGQTVTLRLDPTVGLGSLQAVFDGRRSLLIATSNGAPGQLDRLLGWLNDDPRRWAPLDGSALLSAPGRDPVTVPASAASQAAPRESGAGNTAVIWVAAGVFAAAVIAGAVLLLLRRRRA
ncbi:hypothetical protein [Mycolicibacterium vaccae]|uniref:hypothetical protein n=1 Tax=Mycolicibacterium vaccae TaxID=1810 RepID=UPI003D0938DB